MNIAFGRVAPSFYVSDLVRALAFWTDQLGFEVTFTNGDPMCFAAVRRDAAEIHLVVNAEMAGTCHCHIIVKGIEELFAKLTSNDVTIKQPLKNQPWGLQDIVVVDPDGNTMEIAEPIREAVSD